jgi:hypothetical protein
VRENLGDFPKIDPNFNVSFPTTTCLPFTKTNVLHYDLKKDVWNKILNIKPCMGHISRTWELLLCEYWRKSMIIGEQNMDLKRLTPWLKLRFLTEIGRLHWNQGEEVAHFAWFGEPWIWRLGWMTIAHMTHWPRWDMKVW